MKHFLAVLLLFHLAYAVSYVPDILDKTSGLEHIGTGFAGVARPYTISAPYWNPAGLCLLDKEAVGFNYYNRMESVSHISIDGFYNYKSNLKAGLNFVQEEVADIPETVQVGNEGVKIGSFSDTYRIYNLALASKLQPGVYGGINCKLLTRDISDYSASGYGFDFGLINIIDANNTLGLNIKNLISNISWTTGTYEQLERKIIIGLSNKSLLVKKDFYIDFDYEFYTYDSTKNTWFLGCEHWFMPEQMAWRAGFNGYKQMTLGFGFYYYDFRTDLAYIMKDEYFKDMFLFSLSFDFRLRKENIAQEITNAEEDIDQNNLFLRNYYLKDQKLNLELNNYENLTRIAVLLPDKNVLYFQPTEFAGGNIVIPGQVSGNYTVFYQQKAGKIYKQRISL